jgi:putative hydrolase of the HAD superfamily
VSSAFDAVTFDFWNTLLVPRDEHVREARAAAVIAALAEAGVPVERDDLDRAFVEMFEIYNQHWEANRQFTAREASAVVIERLGASLDETASDRVHAAIRDGSATTVPPLAPNVATVLDALHDRGVRVGIICDVGITPSPALRRYLESHGVLDRFDHWSFSDEVGIYKPHPQIFEHALAGLGVEPHRAAHVGDLRRTDVAGARAAGMTAMRYRGVHDDPPPDAGAEAVEGDHVLDDHLELLGLLDGPGAVSSVP